MEGRPQTMQKKIVNELLQMKCILEQKCKKRGDFNSKENQKGVV
jgi:hypothetical protein